MKFYDAEHVIVDKYPQMIAQEVDRYRHDMLTYLSVRSVERVSSMDDNHFYTTSLKQQTYELDVNTNVSIEVTSNVNHQQTNMDEKKTLPNKRHGVHVRPVRKHEHQEQVQPVKATYLTMNHVIDLSCLNNEPVIIPFHDIFQIPTNLIQSVMIT
jgi:hypothetical protein